MKTFNKRILNVVLALSLMVGFFSYMPSIATGNTLDSASAWARNSITTALTKGFVPVDVQSNYTNTITRQEFCRMAVRWVAYATGKNIDTVLTEKGVSRDPNAFTDTSDPDILAAFALGITSGTGNNLFTPNGQFSREQAATMIMNTCKAIGIDVGNSPASGFNDINSASSWAVNGINFVRAKGIMQGTGNNMFSPKSNYTREQSIITFSNIVLDENGALINNEPVSDTATMVGTWFLESMDMFGINMSEEDIAESFPVGLPYFKFNDDNTFEMGNFAVDYNFDNGAITGVIEHGTYSVSGDTVSIADSKGHAQTLIRSDSSITWGTEETTMKFKLQ